MKARNEKFNELAGTVSRFFRLFTERKSEVGEEARKSESQHQMSRVTDETGDEYLCPVNMLKDPNFVSEREKANCFDYDSISKTSLS